MRQWQEMAQLYVRCILTPKEYRRYRFYERDKDYRYMLNFLTVSAFRHRFRLALNDPNWKVVLDNKWLFHVHFQQFSLPLPEFYGLYDHNGGFTATGKPLGSGEDLRNWLHESRPTALVVKPVGGGLGKQVLVINELHYEGDTITAVTNTGQPLTLEDLTAFLEQRPDLPHHGRSGHTLDLTSYLLQEQLRQHPFLEAIAPYALSTFRIIAFVDHQGIVDIHVSMLRLARKGTMVDNWSQGGLAVRIDTRTGVLGAGTAKSDHGDEWMEVHPDTGVRFAGQVIPRWDEVLGLCVRAARLAPRLRWIGWDVALTPDGPVLIEGNAGWDLTGTQLVGGGLLGPELRAKLAHFGLHFPENELPPPSTRAWWMRMKAKVTDYTWERSLNRRA